MENIARLIRVGAALVLALVLALGYSTVSAGPVSASAAGASGCDSDPYCHWIPNFPQGCDVLPCWTTMQECCLP